MADLDHFVTNIQDLKTLILVHGEIDEMEPFAARMKHVKEGLNVIMPVREEVIEL